MFSAILDNTSGMVVSRSTASIQGATDCIYALDPSATAEHRDPIAQDHPCRSVEFRAPSAGLA